MSQRALGRATLARQHLLARSTDGVLDVVEHLCGLQAQAPDPPYYALWARVRGFRPERLADLIEHREVVRIVSMRGTVHAMSARDALAFRPLVQPLLDLDVRTNPQYRDHLAEVDLAALAAAGRELLAERPRTAAQLRPLLTERFPGVDARSLTHGVRGLLALVQVPPRGIWGRSGAPAWAPLDQWVGQAPAAAPVEELVRRYLAAYGPAGPKDAQAWSGLGRLTEVFDRLRPELEVFTTESGTEVFDLPGAPRPDQDTPAPVRILAPFDSAILAHADRTRILDDDVRRQLFTVNGIVESAVLVDGRGVGFVRIETDRAGARLDVRLLRPVTARRRTSIEAEGRRLLRFARPDVTDAQVRFVEPT
ncbi:winged helix DNA-binding domain-containing protein [Rhodococcus triatomae]|uniref:winged helix DNA-binding domain-containing protein n=1 Tax=Rhodococcus triatomae TaxID=300028 RepID=UPI0009352278|nr:winged helix DNA-binding domain-containing protein [Rhodococcus triatomae]QNG21204.1 winged helix DNA-binding domain-containing protein [Rhodococcus triatomae]QNG25506.1 winged helix DNA-binding domain-containing protein [Rhodococcus triatomae]